MTAAPAAPPADVRSVVVLGDSVAAGEGVGDGYVYRARPLLPGWSTSDDDRPRRGACGRSAGAYGARVARTLGAELANLACSGASFAQGIVLDERFDAARPDLVLVTAGANSVGFERAYAYCVLAARGISDEDAGRIVRSATVGDALVTALGLAARRVRGEPQPNGAPGCTDANPGAFMRETVLDRAAAVGRDARELVAAVRARGATLHRVPDIVVTTYPDPLPDVAASFLECPDGAGLGPGQLAFMHRTFTDLNAQLRTALAGLPGVRVADPDPSFASHRWCDRDPWVHGPSIFVADPTSRAPFHPTRAGQRAIADAVLASLRADPTTGDGPV